MTFEEGLSEKVPKVLQEFLEKVRRDTAILAIILFGSYARNEASRLSDIDVCLVFSGRSMSRTEMMHRRLDYLAEFPLLDIQVFQLLPLYIRRRVLREGKVLYARDEDALYELAYATAKAFEDLKHMYYDYLEGVTHGS
ncbi:MAG: nucleotidyltransferase domain-containing protein [Candidatus Atribacteria bacterium]|nr:nucleotidyltransferase domain-containing protein [Candidatus Atribacteria bacterium]